jgi:hypothetical protein
VPTLIGIGIFAACIYCFLRKRDAMFGLVLVTTPLQAASAINIGTLGIQPFYVAGCFFVFSQLQTNHYRLKFPQSHGRNALLLFCAIGVISAVLCPVLFAGIPVYAPKVGLDEGFFSQVPLEFSLGNIAQAVYLIIDVLVVFAAASAKKTLEVRPLFNTMFYCIFALILIQFACILLGITFPYSIFQNNPGYAMDDTSRRVVATFSEPSQAGLMLSLFFGGYFYEFFSGIGSTGKTVLATVAIALVRSSASIASMVIVSAFVVLLCPVYKFPWILRLRRLGRLLGVTILAIGFLASPLSTFLAEYTVDKRDTLSYVHRAAADQFALQLAAQTNWIGAGLGSNRPSSLITSILSTVGLTGLIVFLVLLFQIARNTKDRCRWLGWGLLGVFLTMCFGVPDITQPLLWAVLAMMVYCAAAQEAQFPHNGLKQPDYQPEGLQ